MDEWTFLIAQFPISYIATGVWFKAVLPVMPDWVQQYRRYDVVRAVDYLREDCLYARTTWFLFAAFLLLYATLKPSETFVFWFCLMSWVNVLCMEAALQVSGKRKLNFRHSDYWTGSNLASILRQSIREGAVTFGLPALHCQGLLERGNPLLFWSSVVLFAIEKLAFAHLLYENLGKKQRRDYGSTSVTGRRSILDTIMYRVVELYVVYYVYQLYPATFWEMRNWIALVTIDRSVSLALFFGVGTYAGLTWIDRGPKAECKDNWFLMAIGLVFRVFESTLSGYPKTIVLTVLLMKIMEKNRM